MLFCGEKQKNQGLDRSQNLLSLQRWEITIGFIVCLIFFEHGNALWKTETDTDYEPGTLKIYWVLSTKVTLDVSPAGIVIQGSGQRIEPRWHQIPTPHG